jgi:hypothetical protein
MKKTTTKTCASESITDTVEQICDLVEEGAQIGIDLLGRLCRAKAGLVCSPLQLPLLCAPLQLPKLFALPELSACMSPATRCGCDIPPPCWAPQPMGDVESHVRPGETATLRVHVTNCGATSRTMKIEAVGAGVTITPDSLPLGPMQRGLSLVSLTTTKDADPGTEREVLVWVRGCHDHYLRWTVTVSTQRGWSDDDVHVEDCPDYVHHWYDHFYCDRPCVHKS